MASKWKALKTHPSLQISLPTSMEENKPMADISQPSKEPTKKSQNILKKIRGKAGKIRVDAEMEKNLTEFHSSTSEVKNVRCGKKQIRSTPPEIKMDAITGSDVTASPGSRKKPKMPLHKNVRKTILGTVDENKMLETCSPRKRRKTHVGDSSLVVPEIFLETSPKAADEHSAISKETQFGLKDLEEHSLKRNSKRSKQNESKATDLEKYDPKTEEHRDGTVTKDGKRPSRRRRMPRKATKHPGVKCFQTKSFPSRHVIYYQKRFMVVDTIPITTNSQQARTASLRDQKRTQQTSTASVHDLKQTQQTTASVNDPKRTQQTTTASVHDLKPPSGVVQASNNYGSDRRQLNQSVERLGDIDSLAADGVTRSSAYEKKRVAQSISADDSYTVSCVKRNSNGASCAATTASCSSVMEMDASSVTMDARAIEIVVTDEADRSRKVKGANKDSIWKRISRVLIDNRMTGQTDCERILRPHPEENIVLKRILNVVFIVIGVCLLVAVFIVIIYTAIVGDESPYSDDSQSNVANSNNTTSRIEKRIASWDIEVS